jgi:hypothetical protein
MDWFKLFYQKAALLSLNIVDSHGLIFFRTQTRFGNLVYKSGFSGDLAGGDFSILAG